jgi:hypothetical protein
MLLPAPERHFAVNGLKLLTAVLLAAVLTPAPAHAQTQASLPPPGQPAVSQTTSTISAELTCTVRFTLWNGFFTASGTLGWSGPQPAPGWEVTFTLPGNMSVMQSWNTTFSQSGANVRLAYLGWGGFVPLTFGFTGRYTGVFTPPADMRANGVPCTVIVG